MLYQFEINLIYKAEVIGTNLRRRYSKYSDYLIYLNILRLHIEIRFLSDGCRISHHHITPNALDLRIWKECGNPNALVFQFAMKSHPIELKAILEFF